MTIVFNDPPILVTEKSSPNAKSVACSKLNLSKIIWADVNHMVGPKTVPCGQPFVMKCLCILLPNFIILPVK